MEILIILLNAGFVKKHMKKVKLKVKDHIHIIGKYQGSAHQECNLNLSLTKKIPVVFHNLWKYDSPLIFQEIGKYNLKCYAKNDRKIYEFYSSTTKKERH